MNTNLMFSSAKEDWYTPEYLLELCRLVMGGITLDPCSNPYFTTGAEYYYTWRDNGLNRDWFGNVFMNPPYGRGLLEWVLKHNQEARKHMEQSMLLLPARTDTEWFHTLDFDAFVLLEGRVKFIDGALLTIKEAQLGKWAVENRHLYVGDAAPFPSMITYKGKNIGKFKEVMKSHGKVLLNA